MRVESVAFSLEYVCGVYIVECQCGVFSVECGVLSALFGVFSIQCGVWSVSVKFSV